MGLRLYLMIGALTSAAATLAACEEREEPEPAVAPAGPDGIQVVYAKNGDLIGLTGKVTSIAEDGFVLDYGTGSIPVASSRTTSDSTALTVGDAVVVVGRFDELASGARVVGTQVAMKREPRTSGQGR
ncbi:MAG TPA: hypothetical protein VGR19_07405 [Allosphingosinicella sp.]|nr:hypothetical protein [Allosphingosinicella sp.]